MTSSREKGVMSALQLFDIIHTGILHDFFELLDPVVTRAGVTRADVTAVYNRVVDMEQHVNHKSGSEIKPHLERLRALLAPAQVPPPVVALPVAAPADAPRPHMHARCTDAQS